MLDINRNILFILCFIAFPKNLNYGKMRGVTDEFRKTMFFNFPNR